jgi:2-iminobutanoate/2-iminopropanoate deaminase
MEIVRQTYSHLPKPFGAFCHAVKANGFLFLSGFTASNSPAEKGDILEQTTVVMDRLESILKAEGGSLSDVIRVTVYVTELDKLMDIHEIRFRYFGDALPASTLVQVTSLVQPNNKIEIEAIAAIPN